MNKPEYQDTPLGLFPSDWKMLTFADIAEINPPRARLEDENSIVTFLPMAGVSEDGAILEWQAKPYREVVKGFTSFLENDVLVAKITPCFENGKGAIARKLIGGIGFGSTEFHVIRAKDNYCLPDFIHLHTRSQSFRTEGEKSMVGSAGQKRVPTEFLRQYRVAVPPLPEQEKIAAILTAVDDKLDVISRHITVTQTLKQGLMQTLFSRGVGSQDVDGQWSPHATYKESEIGKVPATWQVHPLGKLAIECRKRNSGSIKDGLLCGVVKNQGLVPMRERVKGASTDRCRIVEPDAFAYNPMRINIGSIARNRNRHAVMVSPDYVVFETIPSLLAAEYLDHFRTSGAWKRFVSQSGDGGVRVRIYFDHLAHLLIPTPPLKEQQRIVEILNGVNAKLKSLAAKQSQYQTLKRGLMQKLLTGERRVKLDDVAMAA